MAVGWGWADVGGVGWGDVVALFISSFCAQ